MKKTKESWKRFQNHVQLIFCGESASILSMFFLVLLLTSCKSEGESEKAETTSVREVKNTTEALPVIFETDMGNDIDDALALDMLYKYMDQGKIDLLAINSNKNNEYSIQYIDLLNTWYGYHDVSIGKVVNGADSENDSRNYAQATVEYEINSKPAFERSIEDYNSIPEASKLYRQILSQQSDSSVVIISVGFSTNLAKLLETEPDEFSNLNGRDLVAKKIKLLSIMAGSFEGNKVKEYNVVKDVDAADKVFAEWPTPIVTSPFEVGISIEYPATSIEEDFTWAHQHPVVVAYEDYLPMPYDRPTWDLTSVLYAVEGPQNYFTLSERGKITVEKSGHTNFEPDPKGKHRYIKVTTEQAERVKQRFVELITSKPKNMKQENNSASQ